MYYSIFNVIPNLFYVRPFTRNICRFSLLALVPSGVYCSRRVVGQVIKQTKMRLCRNVG